MRRFVSILGLLVTFFTAVIPLWPALFPRFGLGLLRRMGPVNLLRRALGLGGWLLVVAGFGRFRSPFRFILLFFSTVFALLAQIMDPKRMFVALDNPPHVPADEAGLPDEALVMGVVVDGRALAWPYEWLVPRHIVNDRLGLTPVLAAY